MSANQKQAPSVVPQPQSRYIQGSYMPQRPPTPQRTDGFHVATQPFVPPQPPNQANNQVPLRGMPPPPGPPTQSSTPPNSDIKVQSMQQPTSMNLAYVPPAQVRGPTQNFYPRAPPQTNQTPRMPNHRQQPIYQTQPTPYVPVAMQPAMYLNTSATAVGYFNGAPRPQHSYVGPGFQMIPSQHLATYPYQQAQSQPQAAYYFNTPSILQRQAQQVATVPPNPAQPPTANMALPQSAPQHGPMSKNKRRSRAIAIIDPVTGVDKLNEIYDQPEDSHPASGESSARQTPQPPVPNKEVQAVFAKQVAQVISKDEASVEELDQPPVIDQMGHPIYPPPPQAVNPRFDSLVQTSKLQAATKEFVPAAMNTAKETTPVVSAITDAVEVTINTTSKPKDRESPAKGRKQREQVPRERDSKDLIKETPPTLLKEASACEKPISCSKDENKQKEAAIANIGPNKDTLAFTQREDKKNQKKDKIEYKSPSPPNSTAAGEDIAGDSNLFAPVSQLVPDNSAHNAKSKHNSSQKSKEAPKQSAPQPQPQSLPQPQPQLQQQQQQQQEHQQSPPPSVPVQQKPVQCPLPVPSTQPSKPTNKTNKMRELNLKGASKEGTDMDAFNDNLVFEDSNNANHSNNANTNVDTEYVNNTNNVMLNNNTTISSSTVINDSNKRVENDIMTINKSTPEVKASKKYDITDIVKEIPKPIKAIVVPTPTEPQDETDRGALANDKLIQAKNEANVKASQDDSNPSNNEIKPALVYEPKQWSPSHPDGEKRYNRDFLLALRKFPHSNVKPDNILPDIIATDDRTRLGDISRFSVGGRTTDFAPNFGSNNYPNKSSSQRGGVPLKRKSQQGSIGGNDKSGGRRNVIKVSISVKEDVKLHETENAWRPAHLNAAGSLTEDEKKTEELYKRVRGVLNKLTPQKFQTLLGQIRSLNIDTTERLQGVIDLVFEKAVDEPNYSIAYALLCRELALMQVPATDSKRKDGQEFVNFRKLLITRCQLEFEKNSIDETERSIKVKEIDNCTDPEKKKDLQIDLDEYDRRLRMKSVGNIRFIGELFKQQMLTVNIMLRCLNNLLDLKDEESLECLCKLLTTVGKELETKKVDLGIIFDSLKDIADKKYGRISSRVRFMIQDVIDLRQSKWIPRRQDLNPKTMDQIQKEAENEHLAIQAMNSVPLPPRRDERNTNSSMNANTEKKRRNVSTEEGWSTPHRGRATVFSVQSDKLKNKPPNVDEPLGCSQMFGGWSHGSNIKTRSQLPLANTANIFAALENIDSDKRPSLGLRPGNKDNKDPYSSKGPSLERSYRQTYEDGRGSRSGSQHRSRDNSAVSQRNTTPAPVPSAPKNQAPSSTSIVPPAELTQEKLERRIKNLLEEYLNDCTNLDDSIQDIKTSISPNMLSEFVSYGYISILERSKTARLKSGVLFTHLIRVGVLSLPDYCTGLEAVMQEAAELVIDIPGLWDCVAELIAPLICEGAVTFNNLQQPLQQISIENITKLLTSIFHLVIQKKGPNFLQSIWRSSGLNFADYMPESQVESFLEMNKFDFLLKGGSAPISQSISPSLGQNKLSFNEIHEKLVSFCEANTSFDDINNWISANVGDRIEDNQFIRALATAIFESSIVNLKLKNDLLQNKYKLLQRFIDNKSNCELQCLYALQTLIHKLEHPQGLLLSVCNQLYEDSIFSQESFVTWEASNDPAEQEGKGVAIKQLTSFFMQLKEGEDSSTSEDA